MDRNIDTQYLTLLKEIYESGVEKSDRTGTGTISIFGRQLRHDMSLGFPLLTTKQMPWKSIVVELLWFLRGDTNIQYLVKNGCNIWVGDAYKYYVNEMQKGKHGQWFSEKEFIEEIKSDDEFAKEWGDMGPIYGKQWRSWNGIDQISDIIELLKTNPDSRRMIVNAWNVGDLDEMKLPPCHYGFQLYTRELTAKERYIYWFNHNYEMGMEFNINGQPDFDDKYYETTPKRAISLMWNQRSVDTPLGLPFNISSYGLLLMIFGEIVNMVPDELICNLGDTHIYLNQLDGVKEQIKRKPLQLPRVKINGEFWLPGTEDGCGMGAGTYSDNIDSLIKGFEISDFELLNYQSLDKIYFPLSN